MYRYYPYNQIDNNLPPPVPASKIPPPMPTPQKRKKLDFKSLKKDACTSLNDVEHFLCNFNTFVKYIKLYNLLK